MVALVLCNQSITSNIAQQQVNIQREKPGVMRKVRTSSLNPAKGEHLSLSCQCSPLSHPFEVSEYLIPLEIELMWTTDRHLKNSSKRKKKNTGEKNLLLQ